MQKENPAGATGPGRIGALEETWTRRGAILVAAVGISVAGGLLWEGFVTASKHPDGELVACATLADRCSRSLMRYAYTDTSLPPRSEAQKARDIETFLHVALHRKIHAVVVQWLRARHGAEVRDNPEERRRVTDFLSGKFLEVADARWVARLEETPEGRWLLGVLGPMPDRIREDRSSLVISYAMLMTHFDCFLDVDVSRLREAERESEIGPRQTVGASEARPRRRPVKPARRGVLASSRRPSSRPGAGTRIWRRHSAWSNRPRRPATAAR
jgi:hypothetical protein